MERPEQATAVLTNGTSPGDTFFDSLTLSQVKTEPDYDCYVAVKLESVDVEAEQYVVKEEEDIDDTECSVKVSALPKLLSDLLKDDIFSNQQSDPKSPDENHEPKLADHKNNETDEETPSFWNEEQMERLFHCKVVLEDTIEKLFCDQCGQYRATEKRLARHQLTHVNSTGKRTRKTVPCTKRVICYCDLCKRRFSCKAHLINHLNTQKSKCTKCEKIGFDCATLLSRHIYRCVKPYVCFTCNKCFLQKTTLTEHMVVHTKEKPYACEFCKKRFAWKCDLKQHKILHSQSNPFKCGVCQKAFTSNYAVKRHMSAHSTERPFTCEICRKKFAVKYNLKLHMRSHNNTKPRLECDACHKTYKGKKDLIAHLQRCHHELCPKQKFVCKVCKTCYMSQWSLSNCLKIHRTKEDPITRKKFPCEICNKSFAEKAHVVRHIIVHTGEKPFQCTVCGKHFARKQDRKVHMLTHSQDYNVMFQCQICGKPCISKSQLNTHVQTHSDNKPFTCDICKMCFKTKYIMNRHTRSIHSNFRPYGCNICGKLFKRNYEMLAHKRAVHP